MNMLSTSVPWACESAIASQDTLDHRGAVVCAFCAKRLDVTTSVDEKHFAAFNAFYFNFLLGSGRNG